MFYYKQNCVTELQKCVTKSNITVSSLPKEPMFVHSYDPRTFNYVSYKLNADFVLFNYQKTDLYFTVQIYENGANVSR